MRTGKDRDALAEKINKVKNQNWYRFINLGKVFPSNEQQKNWEWVGNYNPLFDIEKINFPLLVLFGGKDYSTVIATSR